MHFWNITTFLCLCNTFPQPGSKQQAVRTDYAKFPALVQPPSGKVASQDDDHWRDDHLPDESSKQNQLGLRIDAVPDHRFCSKRLPRTLSHMAAARTPTSWLHRVKEQMGAALPYVFGKETILDSKFTRHRSLTFNVGRGHQGID